MKIVLTGGGTAGHIIPLVSVVREIKKNHPQKRIDFYYIGPKDDFALSLLSKEGVEIKTVFAGKIRRYFSFKNIVDILFKLPIGVLQSFFHIFIISPDLIFSKGGYGSIPIVLTGKILLTPIFLHESDVVPGLANRIAGRLSLEIFTAFPAEKTSDFPAKKMLSVGNPIRKELLEKCSKDTAKRVFQLTGEKPVILVLGGSQGAQRINDKILIVLSELLKDFEVIHQTGDNNFEQVKAESEVVTREKIRKYYHPFPFLSEKELSCAYHNSDLVISRAGAGTIFELAALRKPSILVPLEGSAQNHQVRNAYAFSENGAAIVIEEENFTPHFLLEKVKNLFSSEKKLQDMSKKAGDASKPDAATIIAEYIVSYLTQ